MQIDHNQSPTFVIRHCVKPGNREAYEQWLRHIGKDSKEFDGHLGAHVIRPPDGAKHCQYTVAIRFDSEKNLLAWAESDVRARHLERIEHMLLDGDNVEIHSGIDFWFTPPQWTAQARPWKQYLVVLSAIYPLTIVVPWLLAPVFDLLPEAGRFWLGKLLGAGCITGLMVYLIMPRYTRLVSGWLYK